jgi:hypothetical protein
MFISAKMIAITNISHADFFKEFGQFAFEISVASLCGVVLVLFIFVVAKKYKRMPHKITVLLLFSQVS